MTVQLDNAYYYGTREHLEHIMALTTVLPDSIVQTSKDLNQLTKDIKQSNRDDGLESGKLYDWFLKSFQILETREKSFDPGIKDRRGFIKTYDRDNKPCVVCVSYLLDLRFPDTPVIADITFHTRQVDHTDEDAFTTLYSEDY